MKLSVLDQSPVREGVPPADAVHKTIELARHVDGLGYHRYWLAEHHGSPGRASTAPEILITRVAAETHHLRVGSGGVVLIDLGIGRAPGSDLTAIALQHGPGALGIEYFPSQISDLLGYLENWLPEAIRFTASASFRPAKPFPNFGLLGSSDQSAILAAYFGCALSFPHFITADGG